MIRSFARTAAGRSTETLWKGGRVREFQAFEAQARKRLEVLNAARSLDDLRALRSNKLHQLQGDRKGQWSIWINAQWRICFYWREGPEEVEIVDYH